MGSANAGLSGKCRVIGVFPELRPDFAFRIGHRPSRAVRGGRRANRVEDETVLGLLRFTEDAAKEADRHRMQRIARFDQAVFVLDHPGINVNQVPSHRERAGPVERPVVGVNFFKSELGGQIAGLGRPGLRNHVNPCHASIDLQEAIGDLQPLDFAIFGLHFFRQRDNLPMAGLQLLTEFFDLAFSG